MVYTYSLLGLFIIISYVRTSLLGYGIANKYHCSFEIVQQETIMRQKMLNKFEKQWDIKNDMNNKLRVMKEWYSIKSYVPEEYDAYISYADKR